MKYVQALGIVIMALAMMMGFMSLYIFVAWHGFDLRGGAMFVACIPCMIFCVLGVILAEQHARAIVEGN